MLTPDERRGQSPSSESAPLEIPPKLDINTTSYPPRPNGGRILDWGNERGREGRADFIMKAELAAVSDTHVGDDRAPTLRRRGKGTRMD